MDKDYLGWKIQKSPEEEIPDVDSGEPTQDLFPERLEDPQECHNNNVTQCNVMWTNNVRYRSKWQIHHFCDPSLSAYAAYVFLRTEDMELN